MAGGTEEASLEIELEEDEEEEGREEEVILLVDGAADETGLSTAAEREKEATSQRCKSSSYFRKTR